MQTALLGGALERAGMGPTLIRAEGVIFGSSTVWCPNAASVEASRPGIGQSWEMCTFQDSLCSLCLFIYLANLYRTPALQRGGELDPISFVGAEAQSALG